MEKLDIKIDNIFKLIESDLNYLSEKGDILFGYNDRMIIERGLFELLLIVSDIYLKYELKGFSDYYKKEILSTYSVTNSKICTIIIQIFDLKNFIQSLSSGNSYVQYNLITQTGNEKENIFKFLTQQIHLIKRSLIYYNEEFQTFEK